MASPCEVLSRTRPRRPFTVSRKSSPARHSVSNGSSAVALQRTRCMRSTRAPARPCGREAPRSQRAGRKLFHQLRWRRCGAEPPARRRPVARRNRASRADSHSRSHRTPRARRPRDEQRLASVRSARRHTLFAHSGCAHRLACAQCAAVDHSCRGHLHASRYPHDPRDASRLHRCLSARHRSAVLAAVEPRVDWLDDVTARSLWVELCARHATHRKA